MYMRALGRIKWAALGVWVLAIFLVGLSSPGAGFAEKAPDPQAPSPTSSWDSEIIFNGKIYCSLKRRLDLPFKGVITSLRVHSGQPVKVGDILATYHLAPESVMAIQQRLSPPQISEMQASLLGAERSLVPLRNKQRELSQLVQKKLAPTLSLAETNREVQLLEKEKTVLQKRLQEARQLAQQDREILSDLLGGSLKSGQVPREVSLRSPIDGYVIWVNPVLRVGAELTPTPAAFQVGVMDPMVVRAQAFEIEALQIKIGDLAEVTLDSLPGRKFQAKVSRVSWSSTTTDLEQPAYYEVELKVPNPDLVLKDGLKARIVLHRSK
jgi:multidrug efflux pump subunit AcrA (membrane-fusion protein)